MQQMKFNKENEDWGFYIDIDEYYSHNSLNTYLKKKITDVIIPDDTLMYIITNKALTHDEAGVRNLKRCLEIIYTKLNLYRLMKPDSNLFEEDMSLKVEFPFTVTKDIVDKLIKNNKDSMSSALYSLYA